MGEHNASSARKRALSPNDRQGSGRVTVIMPPETRRPGRMQETMPEGEKHGRWTQCQQIPGV